MIMIIIGIMIMIIIGIMIIIIGIIIIIIGIVIIIVIIRDDTRASSDGSIPALSLVENVPSPLPLRWIR